MRLPDSPEMGAQFAQLVKELRSEYGGAVQACAFRISQVGVLANRQRLVFPLTGRKEFKFCTCGFYP